MTSKTPGTPGSRQGAPGAPFAHADSDSSPVELESTAPCTPSPHLLSVAHQQFCQQYISTEGLNATKAYQAVYPQAGYDSARSEASRLLANPNIQHEIQRLMDERAQVTGITSDRILLRLWQMATADPRELVEVRIGCCRHCWGMYHQHQYTDSEIEKSEADHIHAEARRRKREGDQFEPREFHSKGGSGFDPSRKPHPECPECGGQGIPQHLVKDTRDLSAGALMIFGGVKLDKNGNVTVLVRDQLAPLKLAGEHIGMWSGRPIAPVGVDPLQALLDEIRGDSGVAAALPIVHDDPELRTRNKADAQDVTPRAPGGRKQAPQPPKGAPGAPLSWRPA
jgi:phage terminase small subunit